MISQVRCKRCLMDTTDPEIKFDAGGGCNHCEGYLIAKSRYQDSGETKMELGKLLAEIKASGERKKYDCIIGVSGGVDSTYVAYMAKKLGLRPLAVHVDNGWNSELAVNNIENCLKKLDIPLYTHVIDWEEFRDLQLSMLKASVPDAELPTDHAIRAVLMQVANREGVKYMLNGRNFTTEGILPWSWTYSALDWKYLHSIHKKFGKRKLKNYPHFGLSILGWFVFFKRIKNISILNYVAFSKQEAMKILQQQLGWRDYGGKHYESVYTRFFQGYILPRKFNIDKRKAHLSVLVASQQITRADALREMEKPPLDTSIEAQDKEFVVKKLGITMQEFEDIMQAPVKTCRDYPNHSYLLVPHKNGSSLQMLKILRILRILPKGFADNILNKNEDERNQKECIEMK